jgi:tetratricopeptide (TPR) repeat protein
MATQMWGDFESAVDAYEMAAIYDPENPVPYFYLAKCLFAMHERQSSLLALEMAVLYAQDIPKYQELKLQALEAQAQLKKHIY